MNTHFISAEHLTIDHVGEIMTHDYRLALSDDARARIVRCREYLDRKIEATERPIYGVTTGFGSLCNVSVQPDELSQLQINLMMSHACGTGDRVPNDIVRLMLLLKIQSLSYGFSGCKLDTVERLIDLFNHHICPIVYMQGSLGASGDLVPLAHLCLPLVGLGEVEMNGEVVSGAEMLRRMNWEPIHLASKEGLALLNGTQNMSAFAVWCLLRSKRLSAWADRIAAMSLDAYNGLDMAFNPASKDTIDYVWNVIETEINSATDNPTVCPDEDLIISAGNFHGQPIALPMDFLAIALSELANISERRIYKLVSGTRDLPSFLVANPGLNSGFMITQYTAASIVSLNKSLCTPASVDSIPSSQGQEDHVSMGANAAIKLYKVVLNTERVLAIELFNAAQALEFRFPLRSSEPIMQLHEAYRRVVPFIVDDEVMYPHIRHSVEFLQTQPLQTEVK